MRERPSPGMQTNESEHAAQAGVDHAGYAAPRACGRAICVDTFGEITVEDFGTAS